MNFLSRILGREPRPDLVTETRALAKETSETVDRLQEKRQRLQENPNFPFSGFVVQGTPRKPPKVIHRD
jgi:hypothetical protein